MSFALVSVCACLHVCVYVYVWVNERGTSKEKVWSTLSLINHSSNLCAF